jgi:hypothetical protein
MAGGPHLDHEMWEMMNPNPPLFVHSNSGVQSFPGQIIENCKTGTRKTA